MAYLMIVGVFLWVLSSFYIPGKGFTYFVFFGDKQPPVISDLQKVDHYVREDPGYDGQFYVQIAIDPTLRNPELRTSIDNLPYRARRILTSGIAYVMGGGKPERILHAYTLLSPIAWFALAALLLFWFPPTSWSNWFRWSGVLFTSGMWTSVLRALSDCPSLLLVAIGVFLFERRRPFLATLVLAVSGLAKETNILGATLFARRESVLSPRQWPVLILRGALILAPLVLWLLYIEKVVGLAGSGGGGNFSWPFVGWAKQVVALWCGAFFNEASDFSFQLTPFRCLLGVLALTVQFIYLVVRPQWESAWWRVGITFALLMAVIGDAVWEGDANIAAFRVLLPMQLAFNVLVPYSRRWWPVLVMGNLSLLTELYTILF
ncbi:hypothetical protein [Cephaloticoccus primus]|uniref:hypothetical protein n=1 Tax=Cephaloticoccus primus TaxID=1548207 RepID=UPI0012E818B5|nr:hypothetical protein [Cephaloticoccus primus]